MTERASSFRMGTVIVESFANLRATPVLTGCRMLVAMLAGFGMAYATVAEVSSLEAELSDAVRAGAFVWVVSSTSERTGLDVAKCDALQSIEGVTSAGAISGQRAFRPTNQPRATYRLLTVTPGYVRTVWPMLDGARMNSGVFAGRDVAEALGLLPGSAIQGVLSGSSEQLSLRVADVPPPSPRVELADRDLVVVQAPTGRTGSCLVSADASHTTDIPTLLRAWFPAEIVVQVRPLQSTDDVGANLTERFDRRPSSLGWAIGLAFVWLVNVALWFDRRADAALYLTLGMSRRQLFGGYFVEVVVAAALPIQVGVSLAIAAQRAAVSGLSGALVLLESTILLIGLIPLPLVAGWWLVRRRWVVNLLKGR